jgi:hypothetical protein
MQERRVSMQELLNRISPKILSITTLLFYIAARIHLLPIDAGDYPSKQSKAETKGEQR